MSTLRSSQRAQFAARGDLRRAHYTARGDLRRTARLRRAASGAWRALTSLAVVGIVGGAGLLWWQGKLLEAEDDEVLVEEIEER